MKVCVLVFEDIMNVKFFFRNIDISSGEVWLGLIVLLLMNL